MSIARFVQLLQRTCRLNSTSPAILGHISIAAADIKLAHSIFALPFALLAAVLARSASEPWTSWLLKGVLVVLCMVSARTWAMLVNRIADRRIDAANPRTARRAIASGQLPARRAVLFTAASGALFVALCAGFLALGNPWPLVLSIPVLAWIAGYSFTKRFTALCHLWLGASLAASPLAAALAVDPAAVGLPPAPGGSAAPATSPSIYWIASMVLVWVAGFDIIYALQDMDFDRGVGLHSIPAKLGPARALWVSRVLHALAFVFLVLAARAEPRFDLLFGIGIAGVGILLCLEHAILAVRGRRGLDVAFFTINGVVSCLLGAIGISDSFF